MIMPQGPHQPSPDELLEFSRDTPQRAEDAARLTEVASVVHDRHRMRAQDALHSLIGGVVETQQTQPESYKERWSRFETFMATLSRVNPRAHEKAEEDFSFAWAPPRQYEGMQVIIDQYSGFVTESTSQHDEVASPDVPLSAE